MKRGRLSTAAVAYITGTSILAIAVAVIRWPSETPGNLVVFAVVTGLGMLAHAYPIQGFRHQAYQVTLPFIIIAAATLSAPQLVAFIVLIHLAEQARLRRRLSIQWFNVCDYYLSAAAAAAAYQKAAQLLPDDAFGHVTAAISAGCAFVLLNRVLLAGVLWLARGLSPLASGLFQSELLAADLIITWIAGPMLLLTLQSGPWTVLVTAGPLLLARPALSALLERRQAPERGAAARAA
ncbi:MAG TPA: hypothetical protein VHK65_13140 [Candidatus Dormibacteraeota bacterium]|nr:hypothetical protein [Candidatus Dormibacteraeota bacterium]